MRVLYWCLCALGLLSGCASPLSAGVSSANALEFRTSQRDGTPFHVVDKNRVIASSQAAGGNVTFRLPSSGDISSCVSVVDMQGKSVFGTGNLVRPVVRSDLQATTQQLRRTGSELAESRRNDPRYLLAAAKERLANNRALVEGRCERPEQRALPRRPNTRCTSRQDCLQDGAAICFTRYLGTKGCGRALSEYGVSGLLSSPGCSAAAAKLAGEKYDFSDAFVDALVGVIEDAGARLRRSDDLGDNILGFAIGLASEVNQLNQARSCTDSFVQRHYGPLETWQSSVQSITSEPDRLLASCQSDRNSLGSLQAQLISSSVPATTDRLEAALDALKRRQTALEAERRAVEFCKAT